MVSRDTILNALPPFSNRLVLIEGAQDVPDIIEEVIQAHKVFAKDYDSIYQFFDTGTTREICKRLFDFCKKNILYVVEGEEQQTTKAPQAVLSQGYGDCKHYAGMIAGILSAIVRNTGRKIDWKYRFASYSMLTREPGHVFVVVYDRNGEIWIDPVLNYFDERMQPCFITDKKIKDMPLYRVSGAPMRSGMGAVTAEQVQQYAQYATTAYSFIKKFTGDKVPNYPIKTQDTLDKIRADIQMVLPMPPVSIEQAEDMIQRAKELQAPLQGDTNSVRQTYFIMYGEIIAALQNYIGSGGSVPGSGSGSQGAGSFLNTKNILIAGGAIAAVYFLSKRGRRKSVSGASVGIIPLLVAAAASLVVHFVKKANEDQVPDYPIKKADTLDKIRAEIYNLLPVPPTSISNAQALLVKARELQAPLAGNTGTVQQTYYMIYGEIINALVLYLDERAADQVEGQNEAVIIPKMDPATAEFKPGEEVPTKTAGMFGGGDNTLLLAGAAVAAFMLLRKKAG